MTSSTPSPSASELAALLNALEYYGEFGIVRSYLSMEQARQAATLLRRLSETERERDEARALLDAEMLRCPNASALACAQVWGVPPRWAMHHIDTDKALAAAEAERDALREMLAQAAKWFRDYETGHLAKGALDKAQRNRERAEACEALSKKENPT